MKLILAFLLAFLPTLAATPAIYLHHERASQAAAEADCQNREVCLDKTNLAPLGRFNDGSLFHLVTEEKPTVNLTGSLGVNGPLTAANNVYYSLFSANRIPYTTTGGQLVNSPNLQYDGTDLDVVGNLSVSGNFSPATLDVSGRTTLTDSLIGISARWTGNIAAAKGVFSGTVNIAGRTTLTDSLIGVSQRLSGNLAASAGKFSSTLEVAGGTILGGALENNSALFQYGPATFADAVTHSYTLTQTGLQSNSEAIAFVGNGTAGDGRIYRSSGAGLSLRGVTGSSYDFALFSASAGSYIMRVPTGTTTAEFVGPVTNNSTVTTAGVTTATGGLTIGARFIDKTTSITSATTLTTTHSAIFASTTGGQFTLTLPAASGNAGLTYSIFKTDASINALTVDGNASETIGGSASVVLAGNTGNSRLVIICDGTNWRIKELYDEGSFTVTATGLTTSPTGTCYFVLSGKQLTLNIPPISGTSNATTFTYTGVPTNLNPAAAGAQSLLPPQLNNGTTTTQAVTAVVTGGAVYFSLDGASNNWTAANTKGIVGRNSFTYTVH